MINTILLVMGNTAIIYIVVLVGLRLLGKKELGDLSVTDLLFIMLVSEAVGDVMRASEDSLLGGLTAAFTLILINKLFSVMLFKFPRFRRLIDGIPSILVRDGKINHKEMRRNRITMDDLEHAVRENGKTSVSEIKTAVLEIDGKISVLDEELKETKTPVKEWKDED